VCSIRKEDWNEAFNYTSDLSFVDRCLTETQGKKLKAFSAV
jgi:hypothetical protein